MTAQCLYRLTQLGKRNSTLLLVILTQRHKPHSPKMQLTYRCGVGELIWAMTTTRPDLAFASVKLSQANSCPDEHHYHGVKHALKYLYSTRDNSL
jgi:hypothetical protein